MTTDEAEARVARALAILDVQQAEKLQRDAEAKAQRAQDYADEAMANLIEKRRAARELGLDV